MSALNAAQKRDAIAFAEMACEAFEAIHQMVICTVVPDGEYGDKDTSDAEIAVKLQAEYQLSTMLLEKWLGRHELRPWRICVAHNYSS